GRAGNANAFLVADNDVDVWLVGDVGRVPGGRGHHVVGGEPADEVRHADAVVDDIGTAADRVSAKRVGEIVAELAEQFEGGLRGNIVRSGDESAIVGRDADVFQTRNTDRLSGAVRAKDSVLEIGDCRAEAVSKMRSHHRVEAAGNLVGCI